MPFPSPEQAQLLTRLETDSSALVISGPGTGKSRTALELARRRIAQFESKSVHEVLFLSFSNAAINRLAGSAGFRLTPHERRHVKYSTFHSCAAEIIGHYGRFVGLPLGTRVIDKLDERLFAFEAGWTPSDENYQQHLKELAHKGKLCFDVLLPLATKLLETSTTLRSILGRGYPLIIVDEFQDTSQEQWRFLQLLGSSSQVVAFGDPNQIIYSSLHSATELRLAEFEAWKNIQRSTLPPVNHRCDRAEILKFAAALLAGTAYSPVKGADVQFLSLKFRDSLRATLASIWMAIQKQLGGDNLVGVLAPSNKLVEEISTGLRNPPPDSPVRFPVFVAMARDEAAYDSVTLAIAALRDLAVDPTDHSVRRASVALSAMNAMWNTRRAPKAKDVSGLVKTINEGLSNAGPMTDLLAKLGGSRALMSDLPAMLEVVGTLPDLKTTCGRIAAHFELLTRKCPNVGSQLSLFDELVANREPKGLYGYEAKTAKTQVLTYPKAKGREFDIVVMVVEPRHESNQTPLEEKRRLYYVCGTRAKKLLLVVHYGNDLGTVLGPVLNPV